MFRICLAACFVVGLSLVGCRTPDDSWIEGKWVFELLGSKTEYDFRPNGDWWQREFGGTRGGIVEVEPDPAPVKMGRWSLRGNVLTLHPDQEGKISSDGIITIRNDEGFECRFVSKQYRDLEVTVFFKRP